MTSGKLSKADRLAQIDHSTIDYPPFRKNFYIEVPELARMSEAEVQQLRHELDGIKVRQAARRRHWRPAALPATCVVPPSVGVECRLLCPCRYSCFKHKLLTFTLSR